MVYFSHYIKKNSLFVCSFVKMVLTIAFISVIFREMEEVMVDKEKCIGCGVCIGVCPVQAIKMDADGHAFIDKNICIKCRTCESVCPVQAIKIEDK